MGDEAKQRFLVIDGGRGAERSADCWRRPAGATVMFRPKAAGVTDFAQVALHAAFNLFPEAVEDEDGELRISTRYAPSSDPAWRRSREFRRRSRRSSFGKTADAENEAGTKVAQQGARMRDRASRTSTPSWRLAAAVQSRRRQTCVGEPDDR